jgi:hypothetical protein
VRCRLSTRLRQSGRWPGTDERSLVDYVVGAPEGTRFPPRWLTLAVTIAFLFGAWLPLARLGILRPPMVPEVVLRVGVWFSFAAFLLRGLGGLAQQSLRPAPEGAPYIRLNRVLYSPLCLAIALLLLISVWGAGG